MPVTPESALPLWFENVWNRGDEATIDAMFHVDGAIHGLRTPDGQPIRGPEGFKPFYRSLRGALSNINITIEHSLVQGEFAMAHCRVTASHTGDGLGVPATNTPVEFWGFTLARVVDGQIVEGWNSFDFLGMYEQIGVRLNMPAAG